MKKFCTTIVIAIVSINTFAQASNWAWARQATGTDQEEAASIATDASGNVYATGYFYDATMTFGSIVLHRAGIGGTDMYIVKYSPTGTVLWAKSAGGNDDDQGLSVATDGAGNVYVGGYFTSSALIFGNDTLTTPNGVDNMFLVKYDTNGNVLFAKSASGGRISIYSIATDASGNVFATGEVISPSITFGNITLTNLTNGNVFTVAYSSSGVALWANCTNGTGSNAGYSIATDASGNIYETGEFGDPYITFGNDTLTSVYYTNVFVTKYSPAGAVLWTKKAEGPNNNYGLSIAADALGNAYVTGSFQCPTINFGNSTLINSDATGNTSDMFIAKYNSNGTVVAAKSAGGLLAEQGYSIAISPSSITSSTYIYVTGSFYSSSIMFGSDTLLFPPGNNDPMFIVKYDTNLNEICSSSLASGGDDNNAVATDNFGNAFVTGDFWQNSVFIVGNDTLYEPTLDEFFFVAKYNCNGGPSRINEESINVSIIISPNPFTSQTTISFSEEPRTSGTGKITIKITDVLGNIVRSIELEVGRKEVVIEKGELSNGIYFVQITDENKNVVNRKIIIQ